MDEATEILGRVLDIQVETLGRPAAIDTRHIRRSDGTVNPDYYFMALRASIAEGICPWDGSPLSPGRQCYHPVHGNGVTWTPDGDIMEHYPLPEIPYIDERPYRGGYGNNLADIDEATIRALQDWDRRPR